jgi:hypothetical protein
MNFSAVCFRFVHQRSKSCLHRALVTMIMWFVFGMGNAHGATTATFGQTVTFFVTVDGYPVPTLQWRKDGVPIAGATGQTFVIAPVGLSDAGAYSVVATNSMGSATSADEVLTVVSGPTNVAPAIVTQPLSPQTALTGGSVSFGVVATGVPAPSYQWQKNGANLSGATGATLVLTLLALNDTANYTVVVSNVAGSVTSSAVSLTVSESTPAAPPPANIAPIFVQNPVAAQSVVVGSTVAFVASATGTPAPNYQWQKNGVAIAGATDASLNLVGLADIDSGSYSVIASNVAGSVSSGVGVLTVTVLPPANPTPTPPPPPPPGNPTGPGGPSIAPSIVLQPNALLTIVAGNSANLSVVASGSPAPAYQWRKNNVSIIGATSTSLSLASVTAADAAIYSVVVTNSAGSVSSSNATLVVHSKPAVVRQPAAQAVTPGSKAVFSVTVAAIPGASYEWRKNGAAIAGATASVFQVPLVSASDVAAYTVVATNSLGSVTSNIASLQLAAPPVITNQPENQAVAARSNVTFTVEASGAPAPVYQWKRNGVALPGATGSTLVLKGVTSSDDGVYSAEASNSMGYAVSVGARLTVSASTGVGGSEGGGDGSGPSQPTSPAVIQSRIVNVSVRSAAGGNGGPLIVGFVTGGISSKPLLLRGVGPTLGLFGVADALTNPTMSLYAGSIVTASNDDWSTNGNVVQIADTGARLGAFSLPGQSADAALLTTLNSGAYTVQLNGKDASAGVALVEIYDAGTAANGNLINLSVRAHVGAGPDAPTLGFVITGTTPKRVMIRAVGPTLAAFGVTDVLADPRLQLFQGSALVNENDNWGGSGAMAATFTSVGAFPLSDPISRDAALIATLAPGAYTAQISGVNNSTGVALIEVYDVP